ncbi:MAG TPA: two-component sensor histidine kinase, partial [Clostridia bacterium]
MKVSLRTKLSLSFLLVTVLLFAIVSVFANYFLEKQFRAYAVNKQEQQIQDTMALLSSRYSDWGNRWDAAGLESIGVNTLSEGLILRVHDSASVVIWDARIHNDGMCTAMLEHMAMNMQSYSPAFRGEYIEKNYPVVINGAQVGNIDIGFYGPYFYSDNDLVFLG